MNKIEFQNIATFHSNLGRKLKTNDWPIQQIKNVVTVNRENQHLPIQVEAISDISFLPKGFCMLNYDVAFNVEVHSEKNSEKAAVIVYLYKLNHELLAKKQSESKFVIKLQIPKGIKDYYFQIGQHKTGGYDLLPFAGWNEQQLVFGSSVIYTDFTLSSIRMQILGINGIDSSRSFKLKLAVSNPTLSNLTKGLLKDNLINDYTDLLAASEDAALEYLSKNGHNGDGVSCWFE